MNTGMDNVRRKISITVSPNPTSGHWTLQVGQGLVNKELQLYDIQGELVYRKKISNAYTEIDADVAPGVYFLYISSAIGAVVRKLVKY